MKVIEKAIRRLQSPARYRHSLAVARLAADLVGRYGWSPERAYVCGLVHDWAKEWSPGRLNHYIERKGVRVPDLGFIQCHHPNLSHAYVSAHYARTHRWISGRAEVQAVSAHTLGSLRMGLPAKILYVADLIADDRSFPGLASIRSLARHQLNRAFRAAVALKIQYQLRHHRAIHPLAVRVWNEVSR